MTQPIFGNLKCTEAENREHDPNIFAKKTLNWPENYQGRWAYDGSGNAIYAGFAARGAATSDPVWLLHKNTFSGSNQTVRQIAYDSWDNAQTTAVYS